MNTYQTDTTSQKQTSSALDLIEDQRYEIQPLLSNANQDDYNSMLRNQEQEEPGLLPRKRPINFDLSFDVNQEDVVTKYQDQKEALKSERVPRLHKPGIIAVGSRDWVKCARESTSDFIPPTLSHSLDKLPMKFEVDLYQFEIIGPVDSHAAVFHCASCGSTYPCAHPSPDSQTANPSSINSEHDSDDDGEKWNESMERLRRDDEVLDSSECERRRIFYIMKGDTPDRDVVPEVRVPLAHESYSVMLAFHNKLFPPSNMRAQV